MALFKRKSKNDDDPRCPSCGERVPPGANECAMCGRNLAAELARDAQPPRRLRPR